VRRGDDEERTSEVARYLASVQAHAGEAQDPKIDRLAMMAGDYLGKIATRREDKSTAAILGYVGPAEAQELPPGINRDVLRRAQASLDSGNPDPAMIAAGIAAARRLVGQDVTSNSGAERAYMARLLLGHFSEDADGNELDLHDPRGVVKHYHNEYPRPPINGVTTPWPCCKDTRHAPDWWLERDVMRMYPQYDSADGDSDGSAD
jgi:hypothetical protein